MDIFLNLFSFFFKNPPKKIIFLSSVEVYGNYEGKKKISEKTKLSPVTNYSLMKIFQEKTIKFFSKKIGYDYLILRLPGVFGNEINNENIISKLVKSQNKKSKFFLNTSGNEMRDYLYVEDLSRFIKNVLKKKTKAKMLNFVSGNSLSINQIIKIISEKFNRKLFIIKKNYSKKKKEHDLKFDNSLLRKNFKDFRFSDFDRLNLKQIFGND